MNGNAADYQSLTDMIHQTWPGTDEFSRDLVGILTADSGALAELAEEIDARSATPDDAYALWAQLIQSLNGDILAELADWTGDLDGCHYLIEVLRS